MGRAEPPWGGGGRLPLGEAEGALHGEASTGVHWKAGRVIRYIQNCSQSGI